MCLNLFLLSKITDTAGHEKTCLRSIKTDIQRNGNSKFSTLDSSIIAVNPVTGKKEDSGRRVQDINKEMELAMGVSKAILNNVIFCHQEDSLWPLEEGQKLKLKFDAIFGTTQYNTAIDKMIKIRKDYQQQLKTCEIEKRHLEQTKKDSDGKQMNLNLLEQKHEKMTKKIQELNELLAPIDEEMEKLLEKEKQYSKLIGQKSNHEST